MRDGELCRFLAVSDEAKTIDGSSEAKTIERSVEAKTIDRNVDAKTIDRNVEARERQERTLVWPPSQAVLDSQRQPKTHSASSLDTEPDFADDANDPLGTLIDNRYFVEALIARGGMGVVYRCRHKSIGKQVAVKVLRKDLAGLAEAPRRLLIEAQAASAIGNEHIIDITDFGTLPNGCSYLVMELLDGQPLSELIASHGTLPLGRVLSIGKQLADGLLAAHTAGIVHRDLKPENIFLLNRKSEDFIKILDFGVAKIVDGLALTRAGVIVGTPDYMSPEQAAGSSIDHRVDIYSLGVILYELAAGRVPFHASSYLALLTKIVTEPPPPFRALIPAPRVPPEFEGLVLKCLEKRPGARFQSMHELRLALEGVEQLGATSAGGEARDSLPAPVHSRVARQSAPSEEPRSAGSLSAVSHQYPAPASRRSGWGIRAMAASLVLLFSLTWLSYLQRGQPPAAASATWTEVSALPAPPDATLPEVAPAPGLAVAPVTHSAPAPVVSELSSRPASSKAAGARQLRAHRAAAQSTAPRIPQRVPSAPKPARSASAPLADGLLQPWADEP